MISSRNFFLFSLWLIPSFGLPMEGIAQGPTNFLTKLYVTDTMGNQDSVVFQVHPDETFRTYSPQLGEVRKVGDWDTLLDVRLSESVTEFSYYKHLVKPGSNSSGQACLNNSSATLWIYAKHQPVTVSWNQNDFRTRCQQESSITNNGVYQVAFPDPSFWPDSINGLDYSWACMAVDTSYTVDTRDSVTVPIFIGGLQVPLSNGTEQFVAPIFLEFQELAYAGPCLGAYVGPSSTSNILLPNLKFGIVPGGELTRLSGLDPSKLYSSTWYTVAGQLISSAAPFLPASDGTRMLENPTGSGPLILTIRDGTGRSASSLIVR